MCKKQQYSTASEAAKLFNIGITAIYRWEKQGLIKSHQFNSEGKKLFMKEEISDLINENKRVSSSDIKPLKDCDVSKIGTKAKNIKRIKEEGKCSIPKTLVINTIFFNQLLIENKILDPLNYNWSKFEIPPKFQKIILEKIYQEFGDNALVIRSSATCEDSPLLSFAGQYASFLNIKGQKNIIKAIKLCYQSLFSDNAKVYAKTNGIKMEYESMAIAVQELAPVVTAGVIFTADPVNQDNKKIIIEYTEGLGDSIVSGHKKPIFEKFEKTKIDNLENEFLKKLSKTALSLEKVFNSPQDIEWGWDGQKIYIFQSRNITTLEKSPKEINYTFDKNKVIGKGVIACKGVSIGFLRIINNVKDYDKVKKGDVVLIKCETDISLIGKIPFISALIINGGILSHMAVIAREFNIPCLVDPEMINEEIEGYRNKKIIVDAIRGKILLN